MVPCEEKVDGEGLKVKLSVNADVVGLLDTFSKLNSVAEDSFFRFMKSREPLFGTLPKLKDGVLPNVNVGFGASSDFFADSDSGCELAAKEPKPTVLFFFAKKELLSIFPKLELGFDAKFGKLFSSFAGSESVSSGVILEKSEFVADSVFSTVERTSGPVRNTGFLTGIFWASGAWVFDKELKLNIFKPFLILGTAFAFSVDSVFDGSAGLSAGGAL